MNQSSTAIPLVEITIEQRYDVGHGPHGITSIHGNVDTSLNAEVQASLSGVEASVSEYPSFSNGTPFSPDPLFLSTTTFIHEISVQLATSISIAALTSFWSLIKRTIDKAPDRGRVCVEVQVGAEKIRVSGDTNLKEVTELIVRTLNAGSVKMGCENSPGGQVKAKRNKSLLPKDGHSVQGSRRKLAPKQSRRSK